MSAEAHPQSLCLLPLVASQEEMAEGDPQAQAEQMLKMKTAKIRKARWAGPAGRGVGRETSGHSSAALPASGPHARGSRHPSAATPLL